MDSNHKNITTTLLFLLIYTGIFSQILQDTIYIKEIDIISKRPHLQTGSVVTKTDTSVLYENSDYSLSGLLSEHSPVFIKSAGQGSLSTVSFRGTSPSHTDILWNGISISSPMLGQVDLSMIPVYLIDDVILMHGNGSIQSSSGTVGGSINLKNQPDWNNKAGGKFIQGTGSYNTYNEYLQLNLGNKVFQSKSRLYYIYSKNNFKFRNKNIADIDTLTGEYIFPVQENKNAEYRHYGFLQEIYVRIKHNTSASLKYWMQDYNRSVPRLNTFEGDDYANINRQFDKTYRLIADIFTFKNKTKAGFSTAFFKKNMIYFLKNYISDGNYENAVYSISNSESFFNKVYLKYDVGKNTKIDFNLSGNYHIVSTTDTVSNTGYTENRYEILSYLSFYKQISKRFSSLMMIRKNFIDTASVPYIPYLGVDFVLSEKNNVILKANIGKNYRYPSLNDMFWQPGGNPDLLPEESISGEFGVSLNKKSEKFFSGISTTFFYSNIKNRIIWLPAIKGYWSPQNISKVVAKGVETALKLKLDAGKFNISTKAGYAYTSSLNYGNTEKWGDNSYGRQLPYIPVHSGNFMIKITRRGYGLTYVHNSYSERFTTVSNDITLRDWLYPYFMNHMFLSKKIQTKSLEIIIQFKIYNLFNEEYRSILFRPMPKRNYLLLLMLKF